MPKARPGGVPGELATRTVKLFYVVTLICISCIPVAAQSAILRGQVADESGAVVPGANIVLNSSSGVARTARSGPDGTYVFSDLPQVITRFRHPRPC